MASFTPQPLSASEFNSSGASAGAGTAVSGLKSLGDTIAQGPMHAAQGAYLGAETGHLQVQTQQTQKMLGDLSNVTRMMADDPNWMHNPAKYQTYVGTLAQYPTLAANLPHVLAAFAAGNAQNNPGGNPGPNTDQFTTSLGVTTAPNTFSGQQAGLASEEKRTGMTAGATVQSARIGADASMHNQGVVTGQVAHQFDAAPTNVTDPATGKPRIVPQSQAAGNAPYSPEADAHNQTITPGFDPTGQPTYGRPGDANFRPPMPSDTVLGDTMAGRSPAAPTAPPAATPAPGAQAAATIPAGTPQGPGGAPPAGDPRATAFMNKLNVPQSNAPPAADDPAAGAKTDAAVMDSLQKNFITPNMTRGGFQVDAANLAVTPEARSAILARVNELVKTRGTPFQNDTNAAIEQAIKELRPRLTFDHGNGPSSYLPDALRPKGAEAGPTIGLLPDPGAPAAPSALATTLAGAPAPGQAPPAPTPAPGPSPVASALAGPPPAPAPAAPGPRTPSAVKPSTTEAPAPRPGPGAQAAPARTAPPAQGDASGAPPPRALAALKEGVPTTFANGQTWTLKNGQPTRVK